MWYSPKPRILRSATSEFEHITVLYFPHICAEQTVHFLVFATSFSWFGAASAILRIFSPFCRQSAGSFTSGCFNGGCVCDVDIVSSDQFLCYHSLLHPMLALSFSEHSPVWSPLCLSPCPFYIDLWCIFCIMWNCSGWPFVAKITWIRWSFSWDICSVGDIAPFCLPHPRFP